MTRRIVVIAVLTVVAAIESQAENWSTWEGFQHQLSSPVDLNASQSTADVKWDYLVENTWSYWTYYDSNFLAFNLVYYNGYLAFVGTTDTDVPTGYEYAHLLVLDANTGDVVSCMKTPQKHGFSAGACEFGWGRGPIAWDPESEILYMSIGGDHPWNSALRPIDTIKTYAYNSTSGDATDYVGAFAAFHNEYPGFMSVHNAVRSEEDSSSGEPPMLIDEWNIGTFGPSQHASNRSAAFDLQIGSPLITCGKGTGHNKASSAYQTNKYTGRAAREDWDQFSVTETGWPVWKFWYSSIVSGNRVYYMGPYDPTQSPPDNRNSQIGLHLTGIEYEFQDNQPNDGYTGPGYRETAHPLEPFLFDYKIESDTSDGSVSWPGTGGSSQLHFLAEDDGVWVVWSRKQTGNHELVHATEAGVYQYDLGIGADAYLSQNSSLAYTDLGANGEYIVFLDNADPIMLVVFSEDNEQIEYTYNLTDNYSNISYPHLVIAGKYALVCWLDIFGSETILNAVSFDITDTAPATPPTPLAYTIPNAATADWRVELQDLIAVNGTAYCLVSQDEQSTNTAFIDHERVIALGAIGQSVITVDFSVSPDTAPGRLTAVCDASGCITTDPGGIVSYEWDFDYDYINFTSDASGKIAAHTYTYDSVNTEENWYAVALKVTDSTGRSEIRTAKVTVTPDVSANQSDFYTVSEETAINSSVNDWNDSADSNGQFRCSGSYGGDYGTGEHSRGYVNFDTVSLSSAYDFVEAKLHFTVARVNNNGPSTVHRMAPAETLTSSSTWSDISAMTGVDQDGSGDSPIEPLDTRTISNTGTVSFSVDDAILAWLGRGPYSTPEAQTGFLICVDDNTTPGTIDTASFYAGEKDSFQWDWTAGSCQLEIIYNDPSASTPETLSAVRPGATASETYDNGVPLDIYWGGSGPVDSVDIDYSTTSGSGGWTSIASGEANDGHFAWMAPVAAPTVWIRITKADDTSVSAVSANAFEITSAGPSPGSLQWSVATASVGEDGTSVTLTVTRTGGTSGAVSINYSTTDGTATAGSDYTAVSDTLNWTDGDSADKTITITILDDTDCENDETFTVTLSGATGGAALGSPSSATVSIFDDDSPGTLQLSNISYSADEGDGTAEITVTRTDGYNGAVSVHFATVVGGTATPGTDYTAIADTVVNFADGDTAPKTVNITIIDDDQSEASETVSIELSSPAGGAVLGANTSAFLTISDNDAPLATSEPTQNGCSESHQREPIGILYLLLVVFAIAATLGRRRTVTL